MQPKSNPEIAFGDIRLPQRFWAKVVRSPNGCWEWCGAIAKRSGYGRFLFDSHRSPGKKRGARDAHRGAYLALCGAVPRGLELDHVCRNRACVNPTHLEPVTARENVLRGIGPSAINAARTHCPRGHEFSPTNTAATRGSDGRTFRCCIACRRARGARQRAKRRGAT